MMVAEIKYFRFSGTLTRSVKTSKRRIKHKQGYLIRLKSSGGIWGYGEISPLPGFSYESVESIESALSEISHQLCTDSDTGSFLNNYTNLPSLIFGIEQAVKQIELRQNENKFDEIKIPVNYMIGSTDTDEIIELISMANSSGWQTVKLKLGVKPFEIELDMIKQVRKLFPDIALRFDMNGAWSFNEAVRCINILSKFNIEYIEQPVEGLEPLFKLADSVEVPIVPDESVFTYQDAVNALDNKGIKHIVIKPMRFGFNNTEKIIEYANSLQKKVIISTMFESYTGLNGLLYLSSKVKHKSAHGINQYLVADRLKELPSLTIENGSALLNRNWLSYNYSENLFK